MDKKEVLKIARSYQNLVAEKFEFEEMYLFGSFVNGTQHEHSDIDIAVVMPDFENTIEMQVKLMALRRKLDSRIEPHPFRAADFNEMDPVVHEILKYGKRLPKS